MKGRPNRWNRTDLWDCNLGARKEEGLAGDLFIKMR